MTLISLFSSLEGGNIIVTNLGHR